MTDLKQVTVADYNAIIDGIGEVLRKNGINPVGVVPKRIGPKFVVHMIGFNNLVLSKNCIESVLEHSPRGEYRFVLTNNGSTDGTKEYFDDIAAQFDHVTVVHNAQNEVFQIPNEVSFKMARDLGAKYHVSLNNDVTVVSGWLERLAAPMDADENIWVTGPMGGCSRMNERMQGCDDTKTEFIEGSCMMVAVAPVWSKWGRLFASYLSEIYHEDSDLSLRVQYAGKKIQKVPFRIMHRGSQTAGSHPEAKVRCAAANARNEAVMLKKWAHWNKVRRFDHPILIRRKFAVGDVLLTTPIIRALHEKMPLCPIYVETDYPELFAGNQCVRGAMVPNGVPWSEDTMVVDFDMAYERTPSRHVLESYAEAAGLDYAEVPRRLEYHGLPEHTALQNFMANGPRDKWAAVAIGPTSWPAKNWPNDRWNSVVQHLRGKGYKVMLFGDGPKDALILADADHRGQSGIKDFAGLLAQCSLFVGLDSFPSHLAAALEVPSVVLYGITDPKCFAVHTAPFVAVSSDPAHPDTGRRNREPNVTYIPTSDAVMRTISVEAVVKAVEEVIKL